MDGIIKRLDKIIELLQAGLDVDKKKDIVSAKKKEKKESFAAEIRQVFFKAYKDRWGIEPVWAAKENVMANNLVCKVGIDAAKGLVKHYPLYRDPWHERQKHPFSLLVSQIDKVRIELKAQLQDKSFNPGNSFKDMAGCERCQNSGWVYHNGGRYRCVCPKGEYISHDFQSIREVKNAT